MLVRGILRQAEYESLPLPGAWIEIHNRAYHNFLWLSLPLPGAWIEIPLTVSSACARNGRSLYRERGLKLLGGTVRLGVV